MAKQFFEKPILNSPYAYPAQHWELDPDGQPTNRIICNRRSAEFLTPIPNLKKRRQVSQDVQQTLALFDTEGISTDSQTYGHNEESFFVRHAYFLGASDPYKSLKTTLKAEIDEEVWESLYNDTSRPFDKPKSGRIAVKVINHLGDEVMKVFSVN